MAKIYGNYPKNTVGYEILNGGIGSREEGLRLLSKDSDRQKLLGELAVIAKTTKDPVEKRSIESTLKKFDYKPGTARATPTPKPTTRQPEAKANKPVKAKTYTVMDGKRGKTFATHAEAKAYEEDLRTKKGKVTPIVESTKKPTHKMVKFFVKAKKPQ